MLELNPALDKVLNDFLSRIDGGGWGFAYKSIYYQDQYGNRHSNLAVRVVTYSESFFGFLRHFGDDTFLPLMVFSKEPIPDDEWDGDVLAHFAEFARLRRITQQELAALADAFDGRTDGNPNPLVGILWRKLNEKLSLAAAGGYQKPGTIS